MNIAVIAPYKGMIETVKRMEREFPNAHISVHLADLEEAVPLLGDESLVKADLFISRGGTANVIRKWTDKPVIEIPISGYDILRTILLIQAEEDKAEIIAFENISHNFNKISELIGTEIPITAVEAENEVEPAIIQAKAEGRKLIVGDTITTTLAQKFELEGVLITSGEESVRQAFEQAEEIGGYVAAEAKKAALFKKCAEQVDLPYVLVDQDDHVHLRSQAFTEWMAGDKEGIDRLLHRVSKETSPFIAFEKDRVNVSVEPLVLDSQPFRLVSFQPVERALPPSVSFFQSDGLSLPLVLGTHSALQSQFASCKEKGHSPIVIRGMKGSGERSIAAEFLGETALEVDVELCQDYSAIFELRLPLYLIHFERIPLEEQRLVLKKVEGHKAQVVLFTEISEVGGSIESSIVLPELQEREEEWGGFVRRFIAEANTIFGKQVIGVKGPLVVRPGEQILHLRETIYEKVKQARGSYILMDEDGGQEGYVKVNLRQSLEELEKEFIQLVLEEENFNQSKAAERLGINRTTLWRKLK
ncbi:sigma-54-dependent transcriptional regulator [Shouchella shacheensis]|uniref:sigma-54-dependent transcriptional regulator n=1 Tax=Shouchella shacheensis TaxID=1649580 RepID=UPI00073FCE36|nr:PrpR N-terminal domain-containing protein [Shouchella shacheensis]